MSKENVKIFYGILAGLIIYSIIGSIGLYLLRACWANYAIAYTTKSYTLAMLLARLSTGLFASIIAGISAKKIANDYGKSALFVGSIIFLIAAYIHFIKVWADYPAWYHFAYLLAIVPVIMLSYHLSGKRM